MVGANTVQSTADRGPNLTVRRWNVTPVANKYTGLCLVRKRPEVVCIFVANRARPNGEMGIL